MGAHMALNLPKGGHELYVYTRSDAPKELSDGGAPVCPSGKAVAEAADVVIIMVPDTPQVADVLFGDGGVAEGLSAGKTVVDMSFISPIETKGFAKRINELGCDYLDAPVSGGEIGAKMDTLSIMVGGSETAFHRLKPLLLASRAVPIRPECARP